MNELSSASNEPFLVGLARAFGGAIVFSLPLFMTMEMWWLGFHIDPLRLLLLLLLAIPLLVGLSHFIGFEPTFEWKDDVLDAFVAYGVGFMAAAVVLLLFSVITWDMSAREIVGKIALQAVPGSIGALLAQSQFGGQARGRDQKRRDSYAGETFFMAAGALFLSLNVAPTEEMVLISYMMTPSHALAACVLSLALMHVFVYSVGFHGQSARREGSHPVGLFLRYSVVGYAICLVISFYMLWTFGRTGGMAIDAVAMATVVLSFPAALGAAAARLIL
ncbi:MAG TPA: TIGR02587 family membrane protein [Burkholderiales bacterium]|nr:TIGR02587 family membrane protein [Burkholderiales bacterium]